jgi:hypothetical protein
VKEIIHKEKQFNMNSTERHASMRSFIEQTKERLHSVLKPIKSAGDIVAGYGTSIGATTFSFNYELAEFLDFLVDDDPYRQGLFSPSTNLEVVSKQEMLDKKTNTIVILAPLYAEAIMKNNNEFSDRGGKFVTIWPEVRVI